MEIEPCANVLLVEELDMWAELQIRLYEAALANVFDLNFYCNFYIIRIACIRSVFQVMSVYSSLRTTI